MVPLQIITTGVLAEIVRRQPASKERTAFAWQLAVGPALARATTVELTELGTLIVRAADSRWSAEVDRAKQSVLQKMQDLLGPDQVKTISTRRAARST
jgi:predicted nucleic acid-binding Zn ribbon protein